MNAGWASPRLAGWAGWRPLEEIGPFAMPAARQAASMVRVTSESGGGWKRAKRISVSDTETGPGSDALLSIFRRRIRGRFKPMADQTALPTR
ncbi:MULTISPECIES: hypothetical protein [unclassified Methylobacterium]|uniref:hypothetical protein n=1 Tax=unclassified Methylobacterium TaxID=2615210 RepID=UPI0012E39443|nr:MULTISPECIES: hypothetical protein [unclassified Methylobacterium]